MKFENFSRILLFRFLNFSKTLLFCSFIICKRTHRTSIPSNYIYFIKTTNEWGVCDMITPFGDCEMLILKIKQKISDTLLSRSLHGQKTGLQEI